MKMPKSGNHMVDLPEPDEPKCEHEEYTFHQVVMYHNNEVELTVECCNCQEIGQLWVETTEKPEFDN